MRHEIEQVGAGDDAQQLSATLHQHRRRAGAGQQREDALDLVGGVDQREGRVHDRRDLGAQRLRRAEDLVEQRALLDASRRCCAPRPCRR